MKTGTNYFRIGIFVISTLVIAATFIIILGAGALFRKNVFMETYLDESVQGLDVGSPVKHRGVKIGTVDEISFVQNEYLNDLESEEFIKYGRYVIVKMSIPGIVKALPITKIDESIKRMITTGLRVRLASQGITGTAYLEVDYLSPEKNPPLPISWKPKNHYIPSAPSTMSRFSASLDSFFDKLEATDVRGLIFNLDRLINNLNSEVEKAKIGEMSREATMLMSEMRKSNQELKEILAQPELKVAPKKLDTALTQFSSATKRLDTILSTNQNEISLAVENLRIASTDLKDVTSNAKKYPSLIFFGEPPAKSQIWK
ncbi:MlaD family protein [Leptospira sp. GIMC2001]|uniref:MlaD family protein n=1 Tax=Leptospira sp. GIMC2001 TaxID=1513297 RepID=UPI00234B8377|nr:MlaD family protein [Leptospira sp. GIMC2001]WCL48245.1 MlaD family protein [Leptospira sp. GIMC2001]